ncbi:alanine--tRNA ligase [Albibacterium bauzanense]|uniref:Alanine--tRNA ligase n=1 Tax=Albibacterium bauzanense TaxID=653929 RepID=A0A4R1M6Z3_9SPHI|nr:alanine--tRNA ligase [Albibacterium bauzanense]TCK85443.1 alanyl-tRNA synthetase [Albibacterium bauzanense]
MTSKEIRQAFLDFFESRQHHIVPSAPIVIKNDPTLLFTNAGMNQFKDYFLGNSVPEFKRVVDTQKCLRVSGKHNDLEEVGVDTYHHTMFEMLGNWSFGDYFKKEAIEWSWLLLTEVFKIDPDKIYVTVFEGDEKEGLPFDQEAYDEWLKWIDKDRILKGNKKDNFWEMGDTGPCGPCSEIHIDCRSESERKEVAGEDLVNADHPQVIEIWNNVFMEYNRLKDGSLQVLPAKHVDTGMGFERLVRVLQNKQSNYDTDVFTGTIQEIEKIAGKKYDGSDSKEAVAFRVLSDHIRAVAFAIADGQLPSNTGAGYVIRRILRRAVRYYYSYLHVEEALLHKLIPVLSSQFESVFPELNLQMDFVSKVIKEEEESFLKTLEKGLKKMDDIVRNPQQDRVIVGKNAFELYDTFGFPIDLIRLIAGENNFTVDEEGFEAEMHKQKNRSRAATTVDTEDWIVLSAKDGSDFVGYNDLLIETRVSRYRKIKNKDKVQFQVVLESTPFYAESGGQVGDTGVLSFGDEDIYVTDTKKENELIIHFLDKLPAEIEGTVVAKVDFEKRLNTSYNHSATHLLQAALKSVLGKHVAQKGSLVSPDILRFDFAHFAKMTDDEIRRVEIIVNEEIRKNLVVEIVEMPKEDALQLGAMALFGEKYGNYVRVVTMDPDFSIELCGGTHVLQTGMIGLFVITSESAVASGVRRIEALTGSAALRYYEEKISQSKQISELLKGNNPIKALEDLITENAKLKKELEKNLVEKTRALKKDLLNKIESINGINFIGQKVDLPHADALKTLAFSLRDSVDNLFLVLAADLEGKPNLSVMISDDLIKERNYNAGNIVRELAKSIQGGGGGQPFFATAGGKNSEGLQEAIDKGRTIIQ